MTREEGGEALILQDLQISEKGLQPPRLIAVGDHIEFDISKDGKVVYALMGFQFPDSSAVPSEFVKNGRIRTPYRHELCYLEPESWATRGERLVLFQSDEDSRCVAQPKISPDGTYLLVTFGTYAEDHGLKSRSLLCFSLHGDGLYQVIASGDIRDPSWHPNSRDILYVKRQGERASVYKNNILNPKEYLGIQDTASYFCPNYSPQRVKDGF
jgi:Tol biopolymer transport system component